MTPKLQEKLAPWVTTLVLIAVWWLFIRLFDIKSFILPTPWETLQAIYQFRYPLFVHGMATLATTLIGFVAAVSLLLIELPAVLNPALILRRNLPH